MNSISGNIVDVVNRRIFKGTVLFKNNVITQIKEESVESEVYILPGFVDSHIHIESSMLVPSQFAYEAVKQGTVATVSDPHEIANVCGIEGIDFMVDNAAKVPLKFYFGVPSCVPATSFETSGAVLDSVQVADLLKRDDFVYLSEMMNYPGVIFNDPEVMAKIEAAKMLNKPIDGHAPGVRGDDLLKYQSAGISTDHECFTLQEALDKIALGMKILIREGSAAKNFAALYSLIDSHPEYAMLCSDDLHPDDLLKGHINLLVKRALNKGLDLFNVLRSVSLNPVTHYKLEVGLLQEKDRADFIVVDNLHDLTVLKTFIEGELVYDSGVVHFPLPKVTPINNFNCNKIKRSDLAVKSKKDSFPVITALDGELITKRFDWIHNRAGEELFSDTQEDILKIVVLNRYSPDIKPVVGFIKNIGLKHGAFASTVAHDSHNIIAVGVHDEEIVSAINALVEAKGGISIATKDKTEAIALEVGGLMSADSAFSVGNGYDKLTKAVKEMGSSLRAPFMTLSFMALLVIPEFKIGDKGLFDGLKFELVTV